MSRFSYNNTQHRIEARIYIFVRTTCEHAEKTSY